MLGFLMAAVAGYLIPQVETTVGDPVVAFLKKHIEVDARERSVITLMTLMLVVAVACAVFSTGTPLTVILGCILGYFGARLFGVGKKAIDARNEP